MFQTIIEALGYLSAVTTAISSLIGIFGGKDTKVARLLAATGGLDFDKLSRVVAGDKPRGS